MATEVVVAFGPSNIYCSLGPQGADEAMVDSWNQPPQGCPFRGNLLWGQT